MFLSNDYRRQLEKLHRTNERWGNGPANSMADVFDFVRQFKIKKMIDYGCGKAAISRLLPFCDVINYDPGIPKFSAIPQPEDYLISCDVLEHIEPDFLPAVLQNIADLTKRRALIVICTSPALMTLPDGRNAHLIIKNYRWWLGELTKNFILDKCWKDKNLLYFQGVPITKNRPLT